VGRANFAASIRQNLAIIGLGIGAVVSSMALAPQPIGELGAALALLMLAIAVIDLRSYRIPDVLVALACGFGLLHAAAQSPDALGDAVAEAVIRGAVLAAMFEGLRMLYRHSRGREGLGFGDVKLAAAAGVWLTWAILPIAVEIATVSALIVHAGRHVISKAPMRATNLLPFGLYFAPAIWLCWALAQFGHIF
jgi:leader peptidase (prepilin peptidase)/N-methyltransferase